MAEIILEKLFSSASRYPPDMKIVCLGGGVVPAHRAMLLEGSNGFLETYMFQGGVSRQTIAFQGNKEAAILFREFCYGFDIKSKVKKGDRYKSR